MCYFTSFINKGIKTHIIWIMKSKLLQVWNTKLRKIKQGCNRSIRQSIYHSERKQEKKNQSQIKYKKLDQNAKIRAVEHVKILAYNINIENQQSVLVNMFYIHNRYIRVVPYDHIWLHLIYTINIIMFWNF